MCPLFFKDILGKSNPCEMCHLDEILIKLLLLFSLCTMLEGFRLHKEWGVVVIYAYTNYSFCLSVILIFITTGVVAKWKWGWGNYCSTAEPLAPPVVEHKVYLCTII